MFAVKIEKYPVVIFASPRTGSNSLVKHVAKTYNLKEFNEPNNNPDTFEEFIEYAKNNNDYVVKIIASSIEKYPEWLRTKFFDGSCTTIKTSRIVVLDQITSLYIARSRNLWHYNFENQVEWRDKIDTPIPIADELIQESVWCIQYERSIINNLTTDITIMFEDFRSKLRYGDLKTPIPLNYKELFNKIVEKAKWYAF